MRIEFGVPRAGRVPGGKRRAWAIAGAAWLGSLVPQAASATPAAEPAPAALAGAHDADAAAFENERRDYCARKRFDRFCLAATLDRRRADELRAVQAELRRIPRRDEASEYWQVADARQGGDCDDIALAARAKLLALGWPATALRLATAWTEKRRYHLVLTVDVIAAGRIETLVLDNRFQEVVSYGRLVEVGYRFDTRQAAEGSAWLRVEDPRRAPQPEWHAATSRPAASMQLAAATAP